MKVYARQIAPEYQESNLNDYFPEDIAVCGNRNFIEHTPEVFERVKKALQFGELLAAIDDIKNSGYKNTTEAINDLLPPEKDKYSTKDIHKLKQLVDKYLTCSSYKDPFILCAAVSIVMSEPWACRKISGDCQGDWNYVFYPTNKWTDEDINDFETEYFNTGTEWIVNDGNFNPETQSPEDIDGYSVYCHSWNNDGIKQELADVTGEDVSNVVLYTFGGYTETPEYIVA